MGFKWKHATKSIRNPGSAFQKVGLGGLYNDTVGKVVDVSHKFLGNPDIPNTDGEAAAERARIDSAVSHLNAMYGISPGGYDANGFKDGVFNADARVGNVQKGAIDETITQQGDAVVGTGMHDLNDRMDNWLTNSRQHLSDRGLVGGSVDAAARNQAITGYLQGKSSLEQARKSADISARNQLEGRRASGEELIRTGGTPNISQNAVIATQVADVTQANQQLPFQALGDLFSTGASTFSNASQAQTQQQGNDQLTNSLNRGSAGTITK